MKTSMILAATLMAASLAGCAVPGVSPDQQALANRACTGSGFPATGTIAAPGVPCGALVGLNDEPAD